MVEEFTFFIFNDPYICMCCSIDCGLVILQALLRMKNGPAEVEKKNIVRHLELQSERKWAETKIKPILERMMGLCTYRQKWYEAHTICV